MNLRRILPIVLAIAHCCIGAEERSQLPPVPLIDLGSWVSISEENASPEQKHSVVQQIHQACQSVGFFLIENHGVDSTVIAEAWTAAEAFFDLSLQEKLQHKTQNEAEYPYGFEQSEQLVKGKQLEDGKAEATVDRKETFAVGPSNPGSGMPPRRWRDTPTVPDFQPALERYYESMGDLADLLLQLFALALEQPIDYFQDKMDRHLSALRLVNYYPLPPQQNNDTIVRAGAHTDYGALTILNAKTEGLQVLLRQDTENANSASWYSVPVQPGALIINLGDLMQRWTNDKWVSTLHRVVMPSTKDLERRYSMAYFVNINGDTVVETMESCRSVADDGSKYPPITARDHLMAKHLASMGVSETKEHNIQTEEL